MINPNHMIGVLSYKYKLISYNELGDRLKIENIKVHVEGKGNGLVLLHGWGQSYQNLLPIYNHFKKTNKVLTLDLLGFHENEHIERSYSIAQYAHILHQLIQKHELDNISIIAHSFGARIAIYYASMYSCKSLILTGAAGLIPKRSIKYYYQVYTYKIKKRLGINTSNMGSVDYKNANKYLKETLVKCVNEDLSNQIKRIDIPILLIWGEEDEQTPLYMAKKMIELNDKAQLIIFEKDDHFAIYHQMPRFIKISEYVLKEIT